jgi:hypothetical protein
MLAIILIQKSVMMIILPSYLINNNALIERLLKADPVAGEWHGSGSRLQR